MAESTFGQDKKIPCSDWLRTQVGKMDHLVRISHIGPGRKSSLFRYKFMINPLFSFFGQNSCMTLASIFRFIKMQKKMNKSMNK